MILILILKYIDLLRLNEYILIDINSCTYIININIFKRCCGENKIPIDVMVHHVRLTSGKIKVKYFEMFNLMAGWEHK